MQIDKTIIFILIILVAFACDNPKNKKSENETSIVVKTLPEKSNIRKSDKTEIKEIKSCKYIVREILTTSPRYLILTKDLTSEVVKNGGLSFGISLEGSPNPKQDTAMSYSRTYDYTLYEMYPERQLNTTRFKFNPNNKQLYEYDAVHDQLLRIEFDKNLLLQFNMNCNCFKKQQLFN
jgi:hypothetical protein